MMSEERDPAPLHHNPLPDSIRTEVLLTRCGEQLSVVGRPTCLAIAALVLLISGGIDLMGPAVLPRAHAQDDAAGKHMRWKESWTVPAQSMCVLSIALHPEGQVLASGGRIGGIRIWSSEEGKRLTTLGGNAGGLNSLSFSPDGLKLAAGGTWDRRVRVWVYPTYLVKRTFDGHTGVLTCVLFAPLGRVLATASSDGSIILWDMDTGNVLRRLDGHDGGTGSLSFTMDGRVLLSGGWDGRLNAWDVTSGALLWSVVGDSGHVHAVSMQPNGASVASGGAEGLLKLWDVSSGACLQTIRAHSAPIRSLAFSASGRFLISGSDDSSIRVWDSSSGAELSVLMGHHGAVTCLAIGAQGDVILSGSEDDTIKAWRLVR